MPKESRWECLEVVFRWGSYIQDALFDHGWSDEQRSAGCGRDSNGDLVMYPYRPTYAGRGVTPEGDTRHGLRGEWFTRNGNGEGVTTGLRPIETRAQATQARGGGERVLQGFGYG